MSRDVAAPLFELLSTLGIVTETVAHPAVFTVEEARQHRVVHEGTHIKNLFLRNKKGAMWLVSTLEDRPIDLKVLGQQIGAGHVSFASPERLRAHLGVEPGSVTPFAAMNDVENKVAVVLDRAVLAHDPVHCHPLTNDRTTAIAGRDLLRFLEHVGHPPALLDL